MDKIYLLSTYDKTELNAGPKAQMDVEFFLQEKYNVKKIIIPYSKNFSFFKKILMKIKKYIVSSYLSMKKNFVVIQYPFNSYYNFTKKIKNKILIIHDLNSLRFKKTNDIILSKEEIEELKSSKFVICHNDKMKEVLLRNGISERSIVVLGVFDYRAINIGENAETIQEKINVFYAGNLTNEKSPFVYQLDDKKLNFNLLLYGKGLENDISKKIKYNGTFSPDDLSSIQGNLGLVWDGNYDESDENEMFKNYTKFNNPHKLSCYLAKGMPVIVWKKAAVADFVEKNNIGYVISNIYDINSLNFGDYDEKKKNAEKIGEKIRRGYYITSSFDLIMEKINVKEVNK